MPPVERRSSPRCGTSPSQRYCAATIASQASEPSVIETSTSWPSPERLRSCSAAITPKAAISAPPPMSAIWPPDWTGGPSGAPVSPSRPLSAR